MNTLSSNSSLARHLSLVYGQNISNLNQDDTQIYLASLVDSLHDYPSDHPSLLLLVTRLQALQLEQYLFSTLDLKSQLLEAVQIAWKAIV